MTTRTHLQYLATTCILLTLLLGSMVTVFASEVTGTLSSDATPNSQTTGSISGNVPVTTVGTLTGTVNSESSSGGGGGSRSNRNSSIDTTTVPAGAVLGATTVNPPAPGFPNAGIAPVETGATYE